MDADWISKKFNETLQKQKQHSTNGEEIWTGEVEERDEREEEEEEEEEEEQCEEDEEEVWKFLENPNNHENDQMSKNVPSPASKKEGGVRSEGNKTKKHVSIGRQTAAGSASKGKKTPPTATTTVGRKPKCGQKKVKLIKTTNSTSKQPKSGTNFKTNAVQNSTSQMKKKIQYGKNEKLTKAIFFKCEVIVHMV